MHDLGPLVHYRCPTTVEQLAQLAAVAFLRGGAQLQGGHQRLQIPTCFGNGDGGGVGKAS
jgi:hypothetical protein